MSITATIGQPVTLTATFTDTAGLAAAPSDVTLLVTDPTGTTTPYVLASLQNPSTGVYQKIIVPSLKGRWTYQFDASGAIVSVAAGAFSVAPQDWTPGIDDVGLKLRSRTVDDSGNVRGTFTPASSPVGQRTRPTAEEVASIIATETGGIIGWIGTELPPHLWELAHEAALNRIAATIELSYWPEQIQTGRSPYDQLVADRDLLEARLIASAQAHRVTLEGAIGAGVGSVLTRPQAAIDSETLPLPSDDVPPYAPTGWPLADPQTGSPGTVV